MSSNITDNVHNLTDIRFRTPFVNDCKGRIHPTSIGSNHLHIPDIGGDDNKVLRPILSLYVLHQRRATIEMVDRYIKESLNLRRVQVEANHSCRPRLADQVCHQLYQH